MNIGIIKETICVNVAVFDSLQTAETFVANGYLGDADAVAELPDAFGIGDIYADGVWSKAHYNSADEMGGDGNEAVSNP